MDKVSESSVAVSPPVMDYAAAPKPNPAALRSVMYGLAIFVPFITGILAIREARWGRKTAAITGVGRDTWKIGLCLGVLNLAIWLWIAVTVPPWIISQHRYARRMQCLMNVRALAADVVAYSTVNRGWFPSSLNAKGILPRVCPSESGPANYVYLLSGMRQTTARPGDTYVMIYEQAGNHLHVVNFAFADGHCEAVPTAKAQKMIAELNARFNPPRAEKIK
jgi:prepilin-type processing-associated H-X9-DG protein